MSRFYLIFNTECPQTYALNLSILGCEYPYSYLLRVWSTIKFDSFSMNYLFEHHVLIVQSKTELILHSRFGFH